MRNFVFVFGNKHDLMHALADRTFSPPPSPPVEDTNFYPSSLEFQQIFLWNFHPFYGNSAINLN